MSQGDCDMTRVALCFGAALLALLSLTDARSASAPVAATNGTDAKTIALAPTTAPPPAVSAPDATTQAPAPNIAAPTATTQTMSATAPAASTQVAAAAAATQA